MMNDERRMPAGGAGRAASLISVEQLIIVIRPFSSLIIAQVSIVTGITCGEPLNGYFRCQKVGFKANECASATLVSAPSGPLVLPDPEPSQAARLRSGSGHHYAGDK